jgi:hypothetical protein
MKPIGPVLLMTLLLCHLDAAEVRGESIQLSPGFFTPDYYGCHPTTVFQPQGFSWTGFWVTAFLDESAEAGVSEFSGYLEGLEELPPFWHVQVDAAVPGLLRGDFVAPRLLDLERWERGGNLSLSACPKGRVVTLLQVRLFAVGATEDVATNTRVRLVQAYPWESAETACPLLTLCDSPAFTKICITAEDLVINAQPPICPPLPVSHATWGQVKALYR